MDKIYYIFAQGLLAMLSPLIVMIESRQDHTSAAILSVGLSVVGAFYSLLYFGQSPYLSIRGFQAISIEHSVVFRVLNSFIAALFSVAVCFMLNVSLSVTLIVILIKMSEAIIDLWVGLSIFIYGSRATSKTYIKISALRTFFILLFIYAAGGVAGSSINQIVLFLIVTIVSCFIFVLYNFHGKYHLNAFTFFSIKRYFKYCHLMSQFFLATAACAMISTFPRWLITYVDNHENYIIDAIALSIIPVVGLVFQSVWFSTINKITINFAKSAKRFILQISMMALLIICTFPAWHFLIKMLYHIEISSEVIRFEKMVFVGILYFAAMSIQNIFKALWPIGEAFGYVTGSIILISTAMLFHFDIIICLIISAIAMVIYTSLVLAYKSRNKVLVEL